MGDSYYAAVGKDERDAEKATTNRVSERWGIDPK
jgi:hypothetical protein